MSASSNQNYLTLGLPKGRILKQFAKRLSAFGSDVTDLLSDDRRLFRLDEKNQLRFLLLKPDDVPTYVQHGTAHVGVVGSDVLFERGYDLYMPIDLGLGRCRMVICGLPTWDLERLDRSSILLGRALRVATKFPQAAKHYFHQRGQSIDIINLQGSVEVSALTGLADVIVDLVESGETLKQNGLVEIETIAEISSRVVVNRAAYRLRRKAIDELLEALEQDAAQI